MVPRTNSLAREPRGRPLLGQANHLRMLLSRHDGKELLAFGRAFQVEVMLPNDGFRIARLDRGFADRAILRDEHRDERMPQHVVREAEALREFLPALL